MSHQTAKEVEAEFLKDLKDLLEKYDVEITVEPDFPTRPNSGSHLEFFIPGVSEEGNPGEDGITADPTKIVVGAGINSMDIDRMLNAVQMF